MNQPVISIEEMITYIHGKCIANGYKLFHEAIKVILDYEEEFLDSKGLIDIEEDDIY